MKVYLLALDDVASVFYFEDDSADDTAAVHRRGMRGWVERTIGRIRSSLRHPKGWLGQKLRRAWDWLQRRMHPDEPLLAALRGAATIEVYHPSSLPGREARLVWSDHLRRGRRRHLPWLVFDTILSPLSILLAPLPGPNVIGYWFAYRAVHQLLMLVGIRRALNGRVETTFHPVAGLGPSIGGGDEEWLTRAETQYKLKGLHDFVARIAHRTTAATATTRDEKVGT